MKLLLILLTVLFVGLQLTGYVTWSWWLVFSPLLVWSILWLLALLAVGFWAWVYVSK
jgi:hypothetical protein